MHRTPIYPSDDFPPYLTIFVTGHVPGAALHGRTVHLSRPLWGETAIWLPVIVIMCLVLLPFMKGATIGICWATNIVRQDTAT